MRDIDFGILGMCGAHIYFDELENGHPTTLKEEKHKKMRFKLFKKKKKEYDRS